MFASEIYSSGVRLKNDLILVHSQRHQTTINDK